MAVLGALGALGARTRTEVHPELLRVRDREQLRLTGRTLHRTLDEHVPVEEEVRELLVGAADGRRALLAVTDVRVVVAQDPRDGGECTSIPLEEVVSVDWTRHGPTGSVAVRTARGSCVLHHVDTHRGPAVVLDLRDRVGALRRPRG